MSVKLTPQHIEAIEKALNHKGKTEAVIRQDNGEVTVLMVEKKKIS